MSDPELPNENMELLARLDSWKEGTNPGPIIRWAAAHLRGCIALSSPETTPAQDAGLRAALADANRIIAMMREHLAEDHPDCAYTGLGLLNDASRAALALPQPGEPTKRKRIDWSDVVVDEGDEAP